MSIFMTKTCAALVALAVMSHSVLHAAAAPQSAVAEKPAFDRVLAGELDSVAVENPTGRTLVQTWEGKRVRVTASQPSGGRAGGALSTRIKLDQPSPGDLRVSVAHASGESAIDLSVYVPVDVNLAVRGGSENVTIKGGTASTSIETEAGGITLYLPAGTDADLSLRAVEGSISSRLPLTIFGPVGAHALDGKMGRGGAPVILRSSRGSIELLPDDPARLASAGSEAPGAPAAKPGGARVIRSSQRELPDRITESDGPRSAANDPDGASRRSPGEPGSGGSVSPGTDSADEVIEVNTRLTNLNARVTDLSGNLIPDLHKEDFQVFEDGVEQEIVHFEPVTAPVELVLLLDLSGSTKDRIKLMRKAAARFVDALKPNTRIAVAAFTRKFMLVSDFTDDRRLLRKRIEDLGSFNSGTAFYDSVWAALDLFGEARERRKAVVVLSDGVDNSLSYDDYEPRHSFDVLIERLAREEVTIYPIYFDTEYEVTVKRRGRDTHDAYVTARRQLQRIAEDTGGTLFRADRAEDLEAVYARVASELDTLYSVAYSPKNKNFDGGWRSVQIKLKRPRAAASTRRGYYADGAGASRR